MKIFNRFKIFLTVIILSLILTVETGFAKEIRIVQMSDIHLDLKRPDKPVRKFAHSLPMFQKAILKTNILSPNIIVFSGDMINIPDESYFDEFLKNAKTLTPEFYPVFGNHDVGVNGGISKDMMISKFNQNCKWLEIKNSSYYTIKDDYIFIFMDGTTDKHVVSTGTFTPEALKFLDETLSAHEDKKAIIVQHFPLITPFKSPSHEVTNREEYLKILDKHKNVIMVLAGHYHAAKAVTRNNVLHITTPSMIEYPHAFRYLIVDDKAGKIKVQSKLFFDESQNADEDSNLPVNQLKMGQEKDGNFTKVLEKNE